FIGSHLVEQLLAATDQPLVVLDNFNDYYDPLLKRQNAAVWAGNSRVKLIEGDYGDADTADSVLLDHDVKTIVHLAASPGVPASLKHPREKFEHNVISMVLLLDATRRRNVDRFLFASSPAALQLGAATTVG